MVRTSVSWYDVYLEIAHALLASHSVLTESSFILCCLIEPLISFFVVFVAVFVLFSKANVLLKKLKDGF